MRFLSVKNKREPRGPRLGCYFAFAVLAVFLPRLLRELFHQAQIVPERQTLE